MGSPRAIISKVNSRLKFLYRYKDLLNFESRKTLCSALIQCLFDYSWYLGINKGLKDKLQVAQNKIIRFILNLDNRAHIGNQELEKAGFLQVPDRVKQLKLGHVFKIKMKTESQLELKQITSTNPGCVQIPLHIQLLMTGIPYQIM